MANFTTISTLTLGNTFGAWYAKTNQIVNRLNNLTVGGITGSDGILVLPHPTTQGGFTLEIDNTVTKNMTFNGNVTVLGTLNAAFTQTVTGLNVTVPYNTGVTVGNIVYLDSTGNAQKALADDECTAEVIGVVTGFTGGQAQIATVGKISGSGVIENFIGSAGATLQKGVVYFLSQGVSGAGTTLEPSITSYVSRPVLLGLTGDTGLILPYRGIIAGSTASSSTTIGVSGGVLSLNKTGVYPYDLNTGEFKTDGDLTSVVYIEEAGEQFTRDIARSYTTIDQKTTDFTDYFWNSIAAVTQKTSSGEYKTVSRRTLRDSNSRIFDVFATSGITTDVWKIKSVKAQVKNAPTKPISFSINRTINRLSCTSYINNEGTIGYYDVPVGHISMEFGSKVLHFNYNDQTFGGTTIISQPLTDVTGKTFLKAKEVTPYVTKEGTGIDGVTTADASNSTYLTTANASGYWPIIYGTQQYTTYPRTYTSVLNRRVYAWDIEAITLGATATSNPEYQVSKVMDGLLNGTSLNMSTAANGATMDTSILGWNASYGAVSESMWLKIYDFPLGGYNAGTNYVEDPYSVRFYVELAKYDINTKTEQSTTTIIPIDVDRRIESTALTGVVLPQ